MEEFIDIILRNPSKESLGALLAGLMTPQELETLGERIRILQRLKGGESQRKISEDLGVSIATVTRGNRVLRYDHPEIIHSL